jgi:iron complex outermembrane receptor protein
MRSFRIELACAASALAIVSATQAGAQNTGQTAQMAVGLEEITVTARKREESLIDVPLSVTVFSDADIQKAQLYDLRDIARFSPGVYFQSTGGNGNGRYAPNLVLRGMMNSIPLPRQQTAGVFIDGVFVLGGVNAVNTADVERIEVLKGPQNAYFGRNTFGGAINFISKTPGNDVLGEVTASATVRGTYDVNASIEGPLVTDRVAARLLATTRRKAPHYRANDGGALGEETTKSITGTFSVTPSDAFSIRVRGSYQEDEDGPGSIAHLYAPLHGGNSCAGVTLNRGKTLLDRRDASFSVVLPYFCGSVPTLDQIGVQNIVSSNTSLSSPLLASLGNPNALRDAFLNNKFGERLIAEAPRLDHFGLAREIIRFTAQAEYTFANDITFGVTLGYEDTETNQIADGDRSDRENLYVIAPSLFSNVTAEARLQSSQEQRLRWTLGGTYYRGVFDSAFGGGGSVIYRTRLAPTAPIATDAFLSVPVNSNAERAIVLAGFGALEYDLTEQIRLIGELRYQVDKSRLAPITPTSPTAKFNDWLPRIVAQYKPNPDWTLYASWARGVLPGQFNPQYIAATAFQRQQIDAAYPGVTELVQSDRVDSFEIGSKQQLMDNRLQYTLSAYYMKWTNIKGSSQFTAQTSATNPAPIVFNSILVPGAAKLHGFELETTGILTDNWDVNFRLNYQVGKYTDYIQPGLAQLTNGVTRFDGNRLPRVPTWTGSISSTYRDTLSGAWDWFVRGDLTYTGKSWDSEANIAQINDYFRANLRVGAEREDLTVELFVTNLFNDKNWDFGQRTVYQGAPGGAVFVSLPPSGVFGFPQGIIVQPPDKRDFGVRVRAAF